VVVNMVEAETKSNKDLPTSGGKKIWNPALPFVLGSIRLILIGIVIWVLVDTVLIDQMPLLYPYLNPNLLLGLKIYSIIGFLLPGLCILVSIRWMKILATGGGATLSQLVKIILAFIGLLTCCSVIGIRMGVKIIMGAFSRPEGEEAEQSVKINLVKSIRLYTLSGGLYLIVFGLFFLALQDFMQVITLDLAYPTITQNFMLGMWIWTWLCLIGPGIIFLFKSRAIKAEGGPLKPTSIKSLILASILAICSLFGITVGLKTLKNLKILDSEMKALLL
jgi:hypothetical protein